MPENSICDSDKQISGRNGTIVGVGKCAPETAGSIVNKSDSSVEKSERKIRFICIRKFFMKFFQIYSTSCNIVVKNICNITTINIVI